MRTPLRYPQEYGRTKAILNCEIVTSAPHGYAQRDSYGTDRQHQLETKKIHVSLEISLHISGSNNIRDMRLQVVPSGRLKTAEVVLQNNEFHEENSYTTLD